MVTRVESAAATRQALLEAARELLDAGGPEAVTLREVGARAGVSRGAPYRHFADKESLLTAIATEAWERIGDAVQALRADPDLEPADKLKSALTGLIELGRRQPRLYQLMFTTPSGDPSAIANAAGRSQDEFLAIVAELVGEADAYRYGALLMTSAHGITGMEVSGHLTVEKWHTNPDELVALLAALVLDRRGTPFHD
ncbi:TetR/AcrR family transcriptional regulator [Cryptosporangium phraense]|uniref:TetR/AcrR family transcriptional regulator n=1 Tax=Cryptosporangium phraense TaxID=2593070 RepID=A0A545AYU2_9ACTN|nr:TetR/AcrR family transcriptional regulator [Cryptosporangium phraense]TQS46491.1 TetR/AcrR family transcriptional regulator [Cryptosporangium phraense]